MNETKGCKGMQQNNNEEDVIDLMELFLQLLSRWFLIFIAAVIAGAVSFVWSRYYVAPKYDSTAELYIQAKDTLSSYTDLQMSSSLTADYVQIVGSRPILDRVIEDLELTDDYKTLSGRLTLTNPSNTHILKITVRDTDPVRAKLTADLIADYGASFIAEKMDQNKPSVLHYGYSDQPKVSPSVAKNSIIGALVGAFVVMAIIVIVYLINDAIIDPEDFEKKLGINLLGTLPLDKKQYDEQTHRHRLKSNKRKGRA